MSCLVTKIPEILNMEGIRKDDALIKRFQNIRTVDPGFIEYISSDFYKTIGLPDPLLKAFISDALNNINANKNIFSTLKDTAQCTYAIGPENVGDTCYLCGMPLLPRGPRGLGKDTRDPLYPQCEHVLPYVYGALYLKLVTSKQEFVASPQYLQRLSRLEYKWSHQCCNQLKSQAPFVKYTSAFQFVEDEDNIECYLNELYEGNSFWALQFQDALWPGGERGTPYYIQEMRKYKNNHLPTLKKTITDIVTEVSLFTQGEVNFLRSIMIISFLKYIKAEGTGDLTDLTTLKNSITPNVQLYISTAWSKYRKTFESLVQDANRLTEQDIFDTYVADASSYLKFGKKKPIVKRLKNKALMTKLKSVGIKITKKQGKRRVYLSRPELIKRATAFKNLQLRAKKLKVRIMYKNKKGKYVYKTAKRLMNDIKRQMKKPVKKRTKKPVKKPNAKQIKQRFG